MDKIEDKQALLNQAAIELSKQQANTNLAQSKIMAQMNQLKETQTDLQAKIDENTNIRKQLKIRYDLEQNGEIKTQLLESAQAVLKSIEPTTIKLETVTNQINKLMPSYDKALEMAEMARNTYEEQKQDIEIAKLKNTFSQASKNIADSVAVFDADQVGVNTSDILDKVNQETAENDARLEVAIQTNATNIETNKAKKLIKQNQDPFANL